MYRLWLHGLYGPRCPLSPKRPINLISLSLFPQYVIRDEIILAIITDLFVFYILHRFYMHISVKWLTFRRIIHLGFFYLDNRSYIVSANSFMPPPLGAGGIMFSGCPSIRPSVCPSVRSLKYPLLTCTWVRWSIRPTVTVLRHVCPSVRPERFPGICWRTHKGNSLEFYMLMYLDHLQNWLVYGHGLLIFLILALFSLGETGQI